MEGKENFERRIENEEVINSAEYEKLEESVNNLEMLLDDIEHCMDGPTIYLDHECEYFNGMNVYTNNLSPLLDRFETEGRFPTLREVLAGVIKDLEDQKEAISKFESMNLKPLENRPVINFKALQSSILKAKLYIA